MELAEHLQKTGVQGLVFPSVVEGGDDNLVVYLANCNRVLSNWRMRQNLDAAVAHQEIAESFAIYPH